MEQGTASSLFSHEEGYDPIEDRLRSNIHATIEAILEEEIGAVLGRCRYGRSGSGRKGYRNGHRARQIVVTFGSEFVRHQHSPLRSMGCSKAP